MVATSKLERHLRIPEVSTVTGYSTHGIRKLVREGKLRHRKVGRIITIPESAVTDLLGALR